MAFSLESRIGRGRTAETFAAKLEVGKEKLDVVVKRPRPELAGNEAFVKAFVEWGASEKEIDHDNVVAVLEAGQAPEGAYVIQERVEGVPLARLLEVLRKQKRTLSLALALAIGAKLAAALAHLHGLKRAHGGVDAGEVLISYDGDVKLGDQRLHTLDAIEGVPPAENDVTAIYRAPELADKPGASSPAGDVWALALLMLEMLIGHRVWTAASMTVEASVRALEDFSHVGQAHPELTAQLVDILHTSTLVNPIDRVPSAKELEAGLTRVIQTYKLTADAAAIAGFVRAAIPPPSAENAPTMMLDPAEAEELAKRHASAIAGASVSVDPEVERKALSRVAAAAKPPPPANVPVAPSVLSAQRAISTPPIIARPTSRSPSSDAWPRPAAEGRRVDWQIWVGVGVIALILGMMLIHMATRTGDDIRVVQVDATSDPSGAELYVDGALVGTTPVDQALPARGGRLELRFVLKGYETHEITIDTKQDELRYDARMKKLPETAPR